ncbi:MAG: hypothetical protein U0K68_00435 [Agathobacter sp.]|nr:hypothetical protein [Agathobacter sp.]
MRNKKRWLAMMLAAAMTITSVGVSPLGGIDTTYASETVSGTDVSSTNPGTAQNPYTAVGCTIPNQVWTGKVPDLSKVDELASITVNDGLVLYRGKDYTVKANTSNVGSALAIITGIGNYAGAVFKPIPFEIVAPEEVANYTASVDTSKFVYDGDVLNENKVIANTVVLRNGNEVVANGTGVGEYSVLVTPPTGASGDAGEEYSVKITAHVSADKEVVIYNEKVKIAKRNLATLEFDSSSIAGLNLKYNAEAQKPELSDNISFKFKKNDTTKEFAKTNVSIKGYKDNVNAGTAKVVIEAKADSKNFTGTAEVPFEIGKASLSAAAFVPNSVTVEYNGKDQRPTITGKAYFSGTLGAKEIPSTDYKVVYDATANNSVNPTTYTVHIEAADDVKNFDTDISNSVNAYAITKADLSKATVTLANGAIAAGTAVGDIASALKVVCNGKTLNSVTTPEYKATIASADAAKLSIVGSKIEATIEPISESAPYTGSIKYTFTVSAAETAKEYTSNYSIDFDGIAKKPGASFLGELTKKVSTESGAQKLFYTKESVVDPDYEVVSWENNTNVTRDSSGNVIAGAIANIRGKGLYAGRTAKAIFKIKPFAIDVTSTDASPKYKAEVTGIKAGNYYQGGTVDYTSVKIMEGTKTIATLSAADCEVTASNITSGTLKEITVTGKGNYTGSLTVSGLSVDAGSFDLTNAVITGSIPAGLSGYTETELSKYITVTVGGKKIDSSVYNISHIECATAGKTLGDLGTDISFTIDSANDQVIGSKSAKLTVVQRDIADLKDSVKLLDSDDNEVDDETYSYSGNKIEPSVSVVADPNLYSDALTSTDYTVSCSNNINAGTATVTLTGKGNYKGTVSKTFTINKHTVAEGDFAIVEPSASLREFKPGTPDDISKNITIKASGTTKKYAFTSSDYSVELVPGQTVTTVGDTVNYLIKFKSTSNNYKANTDGIEKTITIVAKTVNTNNTKIELNKSSFVFGTISDNTQPDSDIIKSVSVDGKSVASYSAKYVIPESKVKPTAGNEPYVKFTFSGNYVGTIKVPITLSAIEIDLSKVYLKAPSVAECAYSGSGIGATVSTTENYIEGTHYNVVYRDATGKVLKDAAGNYILPKDVGKYTATVEAAENYVSKTAGKSVSFEITASELTEEQVKTLSVELWSKYCSEENVIPYAGSLSKIDYVYVGANTFGLESDDFEVVSIDTAWDGDPTKENVAKLRIKDTANAKYSGIFERKFKFTKNDIRDMHYNYSAFTIDDQIFANEVLEPSIKVAAGTNIPSDWITVNYYRENFNVSTDLAYANITVNVPKDNKFYDEGKYTFEVYFNIKAASIATTTVEGIKDAEYTGKAITQNLVVTSPNGLVLTLGKDYKVSYSNNVNPGTATVKITGISNYTGTVEKTFKITKKETPVVKVDISKATVTGLKTVTYNGKAFKPVVKVVVNGKTLVLNKDYKVAYSNNIKPGKAKVVITGIGSYKGTVTKSFVIKKAAQSITKAVVSKTFKASSLKKKAATFSINAKAKGKITYKKTSGSKNITVSSTGKVTVKKGTKKGTYTIKVKITAAATSYYLSKSVTKTIKVVVK